MTNYYNDLNAGVSSWFKKGVGDVHGSPPTSTLNVTKSSWKWLVALMLFMFTGITSFAQTTLISATGDGGFETGATIAANNWTAVNATTDGWNAGTAPTQSAGLRCGYVSANNGTSWTYSQLSTYTHIYKDVTIPTGQNVVTLTFKWKANGEGTTTSDYDNLKVFWGLASSVGTPSTSSAVSSTYQVSGAGATSGMYKLSSSAWNSETITVSGTPGSTYRLVFSWKSDSSTIGNPPAALDEISLVSSSPVTYVWNATTGSASWATSTSWTPNRTTPNASDILSFSNGGNSIVTSIPAQTVGQVIFSNNTTANFQTGTAATLTMGNLTIPSGSALYSNGTTAALTMAFSTGAVNPIDGRLEISNTGTAANSISFTNSVTTVGSTGTFAVGGSTAATVTSTSTTLVVNGTYEHKYTTIGGAIPTATWGASSNMNIVGYTSNTTAPTGFTQTFANFRYNCPSQSGTLNFASSGTTTVNGTFTIASTGSGILRWSGVGAYTLIVNNFTQTGGTFDLASGTSGSNTFNVSGTFNQTGGSLLSSGTSASSTTLNFNGTAAQSVTFTTQPTGPIIYRFSNSAGVTLNGGWGTNFVVGNGTLGGVRISTSIAAPVTFGGTLTGFTYNAANSTLIYDATGSYAATSSVLPVTSGPANLTVAVGSGNILTVSNNLSLAGTLTMTSGDIDISSNTLTLGTAAATPGTLSYTAGAIRVSTGSMTRWYGTTGLPTSAGTAVGYYPLANGTSNRNVSVYFSTATALSAGGTITVSHSSVGGVSTVSPSIVDGAYTVDTRSNSSWSLVAGNGITASGTLALRLTGANAFNTSTAANLRVMQAAAIAGTAVAGSGTTPNFQASRSGLSVAQIGTTHYIGAAAADMQAVYNSVTTGDWNAGSTWDTGSVPTSTAIVNVKNGHVVTVAAAATATTVNVFSGGTLTVSGDTLAIGSISNTGTVNASAGTITVTGGSASGITNAATANFNVNGGTVTLGATGGSNRAFANAGTVTVSAGTLNVNGSFSNNATTAVFNQSGGTMNIDGNAAGVAANSVASGTPLFNSLSNAINLTGGTLLFVDPHTATTNSSAYAFYLSNGTAVTNTLTSSPAHITQFGDGVSTDAGGNTSGFYINNWASTAYQTFGSVVINGGSGTNRSVNSVYQFTANGDFTVNSGNTVNIASLIIGRNLTVNSGATLISTSGITATLLGSNTSSSLVFTPSTYAQTFTNNGVVANLATAATANLTSLQINNSNATGVTLASPLSVSGTLTMTSGLINTTATNILTLGTATATGTLAGTPSATNMIVGPFARTFAASRTATPTYDSTTLFPVGKGGVYNGLNIDPTTTAGGPVVFSGEAFNSNSGTGGAGVTTLATTRYEALPISGSANLTSAFVRLSDAGIASTSKILQATSAANVYSSILPASTFATGSLTTATALPVASFTGYFSYGAVTPCTAPVDQATSFVVSSKGTTTFTGSYTAAASAPTGYLVVRYPNGGTVTNPTDYTTYAAAGTLGAGTVAYYGSALTFNATGLTANTTYTYYVYAFNNGACSGPVYNTTSPLTFNVTTCAAATGTPGTLASSSLTSNGFTVTWTASSTAGVNYILDVATNSGFTTFVSGYQGLNVGSSLSTTLTGLTSSTTYYVRVRADLTGCVSSNTSTLTVTTPCPSVSIPTTVETFTTSSIPACWSTSMITGSNAWAPATSNDGVPSPRTGTYFMGKTYSTSDALIFSQPVDMTSAGTSGAMIDVWIYRSASNYSSDRIRFHVNTQPSLTGATQVLEIFPLTSVAPSVSTAGWYEYTVNIPSTFNTATALYVIGQGTTSGGYSSYGIGFDDFKVVKIPTCFVPTAISSSNLTSNGAKVTWTAPALGTPTSYLYEVRTSGAAGSGSTGLVASGAITAPTASVNLAGLSPNTTYTVYLQSFCGGTDYSSWTSGNNFTTLCAPVSSLPWTENFDSLTSLGSAASNLPSCWLSGSTQWSSTNSTSYNTPKSGANYLHYAYASTDAYMWTPGFTLVAGKSYDFSFYAQGDGYTGWTNDVFVNSVASSTGATQVGATYVAPGSGTIAIQSYAKVTRTFVPSTSGVYYFAIRGNQSSYTPWYMAFDDFRLELTPTVITSFTPATVCSQAGSTVTITGNQFTGATAVKFNGVNAASYTVVNNTTITAVAPIGVTAGNITINGADTTATSASALGVTVNPTVDPISGGATAICYPSQLQLSETTPAGTWSSSNTAIATVDANGLVSSIVNGSGSVTFTYTVTDTGCSTSVTTLVAVNQPVVVISSTASQTVVVGDTATFSVNATGTGLAYQWMVTTDDGASFSEVSGATSATLSIPSTTLGMNGYQYYCHITGASTCDPVDTNAATLSVGDTGIATHPSNVAICSTGAGTASFTVVGSGSVVSYAWYEDQGFGFAPLTNDTVNGVTYAGADTATLSLSGLTLANTGFNYRCVVSGETNDAYSNVASLTVNQGVSVDANPSNQTVCYLGGTASYSVAASGAFSGYQWKYSSNGTTWSDVADGTPVGATYSGANSSTLGVTTTSSTPAAGTYYYKAVVAAVAPCGVVDSSVAQLLIDTPTMSSQPAAATVLAGNTATFTAATTSVGATYQWKYATTANGTYSNVVDGTPAGVTYSGATTASLSVVTTAVAAASTANFYKLVANPTGCTSTSSSAQLTINNYCASAATYTADEEIYSVTVNGNSTDPAYAGSNGCTTPAPGAGSTLSKYSNFTSLGALTSVTRLQNVAFNIEENECDGATYYSNGCAIWVDFNQDGDFADAGEQVYVENATSVGPRTIAGSFVVPNGALLGTTRMRIIVAEGNSGSSLTPCMSYGYGETEDYAITILPAPTCSGTPTAGTITSSVTNICVSGTATLTVNGYSSGVDGLSYQWYNSAGAISGATSTTFTTPTLTASETYFMRVTCATSGLTADTSSVSIGVTSPVVTSTTTGSRCGTGTVTLGATSADTINWYAAATGGAPLGTGSSFTTPSIAATTTYYVEANAGGSTATGGKASTNGVDGTNTTGGIYFTSNSAFNLGSVVMYPQGAGTNTIVLYSGSTTSGTPIYTATYTFTGASTSGVTVPLNWNITPGSYTIYQSVSNANCYRDYSASSVPATAYPYNIGTACTLTGGTLSGYYYFFYNWSISTGCGSTRVPVIATVTAPPALTLNGASATVCAGDSTTTPVTITSTLSDYDTYSWSAAVNGNVTSGFTFTPDATTTYTLTASNATTGCSNTASYAVTVNALPTAFSVSPASTSVCADASPVMLTVATPNATPSASACTEIGNGKYPSAAFTPTCNGTLNTISSAAYAGEYSVVNTTNSTSYTFVSSGSGDYVTIMNNAGTSVLAYGPSPLTWFNVSASKVRFISVNTTCTADSTFRTRSVSCIGVDPVVFSPTTGLYTDAAGTVAYTGTAVTVVYAHPTATTTYTATATNASGCVRTATSTVTIDPVAVGGSATAAATSICYGGSTTLTLNGSVGNAIQWQQSSNGTTWSSIAGENATTYTTASLTATTYYRAVVVSGSCAAQAYSTVATVNVSPVSVAGTATGATTICSGSSASITLNGQTGSIQWQQSADGSSWSNIASATSSSLNTGSLTASAYFRAVVTSGACSSANSNSVLVTVNGLYPFYADADHDGFGAGSAVNLCAVNGNTPPVGYSVNNTDCNDAVYSLTNTCAALLNLKVVLQGYYDADAHAMRPVSANQGVGTSATDVDTVTVELHDTSGTLVSSASGMLQTDGTVSLTFAPVAGDYYIVVSHRNTVASASASTVSFVSGATTTYDFTTADSQAYGDNQVMVDTGVYAMYTGDLNQDGYIDVFDFPIYEDDNVNGVLGYYSTDMNGDGYVDVFDFPIYELNNVNGISSYLPY